MASISSLSIVVCFLLFVNSYAKLIEKNGGHNHTCAVSGGNHSTHGTESCVPHHHGSGNISSRSTSSGGCQASWPSQAGTVTLSKAQAVTTSFDCGNKLYKSNDDHVFTLTNGASLSNCYFKQTGEDDAVHVEGPGTFKLKNLYFLSTGDDGISVKGAGNVNVEGGGFLQAGNKAVQHDGSGTVTLNGGCYENVHILLKSCGNCKVNAEVKGRTLNVKNCSISNVKTVCGVNTNRNDVCTITGLKGTPTESMCTGYSAISDPSIHEPPQTSKNTKNAHCVF